MSKVRRKSGWKDYGHWYVKEKRHGCHYQCAYCGWSTLGNGPLNDKHAAKCEKRKAHLAEVQANG